MTTLYHRPLAGTFGLTAPAVSFLMRSEGHSPPDNLDGVDLSEFDFETYEVAPQPPSTWDTRPEEVVPVDGVQQWALVPNDRTVDDLRATRAQQVNATREAITEAGYPLPAGPGHGQHLQLRNADDKVNWMTARDDALASAAAGDGDEPVSMIRTLENNSVVMTPNQVLAALAGLNDWASAVLQRSWSLKDDIRNAADATAVLAVDVSDGWP